LPKSLISLLCKFSGAGNQLNDFMPVYCTEGCTPGAFTLRESEEDKPH